MSSPPPPQRQFTRTGKSMKAVRRYYALKDQMRQKAETDGHSRSRKKSPDKLSKRIVAELKYQQKAIEKRQQRQSPPQSPQSPQSQQSPPPQSQSPPPPSQRAYGVPELIPIQPYQAPPVSAYHGQAPPAPPMQPYQAPAPKSSKSLKSATYSVKLPSYNSVKTTAMFYSAPIGSTGLGCTLYCFVIALVYITTWAVMFILDEVKSNQNNKDNKPQSRYYDPYRSFNYKDYQVASQDSSNEKFSSYKSIRLQAIASLMVAAAYIVWSLDRANFRNTIIDLCLMVLGTLIVFGNLMYITLIDKMPKFEPLSYTRDPLNLSLSVVFLVMLLVSDGFLLRHIMSLLSKRLDERSQDKKTSTRSKPEHEKMSVFMAP